MKNVCTRSFESAPPPQNTDIASISTKEGYFFNKNCNTSDTKHHIKSRKAFTLAEVLITLGIIGVVAALTIPTLVNNYRKKVLETGFKKSMSTIQQALNTTAAECGADYLLKYRMDNLVTAPIPKEEREEINRIFAEQLKYVRILPMGEAHKIKTYSFKSKNEIGDRYQILNPWDGVISPKIYLLPDGTTIAGIAFQTHGTYDGIKIGFDTNGPYKGPNRFGYDLFFFDTGYWQATICNDSYYYGCFKYAQQDQWPDDPTKKYWDNLKL